MIAVNIGYQNDVSWFGFGKIRHHRHRIDDDDFAALFELDARMTERGDRDGAAGRLHSRCRRQLGVPNRCGHHDQGCHAPPESHTVLLSPGALSARKIARIIRP